MFGKLMNQFYYGKSGKGDYRMEDLPQNRWQLFLEMLKIRLSGLARLNLLYMLIWLPALFVGLSSIAQGYSLLLTAAQADPSLQAAATLDAHAYLRGLTIQTLLFMIPCIAITGPFTAGISYVTRNWARDEHSFVVSDFWDAVKSNWRQGLSVSIITSFMPIILYVCWIFYGEMASNQVLFVIPQVLCVTLVLLWMCSLLYLYPLMVTYRLRFRDLLRNGLLLTVGRLPGTLGIKLLSLMPVLIALAVCFFTSYMEWALLVYTLYYLVFGFSLSRFIGASYANAIFDRYINPQIEGAPVGQGIYVPDEDDEDSTEGISC